MSAWRILGPDGSPMVVAGPDGQPVHDPEVLKRVRSGDASLEQAWASEVQKRVRSRAVSMSALNDRDRGKQKPTPVTYDTLRLMADRNEWVRAIINNRRAQVAGTRFDVVLKDTDDPSGAARKAARSIKKLLDRPMMHGSAPRSTHWQQFIGMFLEDLLVLDRACWEKERDGNKWIVAIYPVDGATVRPNLDDRGAYQGDAYVQVVDGIVEARFGMEDLVVAMVNEQTDVKRAGYGLSPLENLIISVTADLHAAKFNASYFEKGSIPEGILSLGEDVAPEDVDAFRLYWLNEIQGKPWALPMIGGSKAPEFIGWRESNRDMQFMEYQDWLLQKLCAVYMISKKEVGSLEEVNYSTAEDQTASDQRKGLQPMLDFIKNTIDLEIIGEHGQGLGDYLEFQWEQAGDTADQINAKFQPLVDAGAATRSEWREAHGMDPAPAGAVGAEGLSMHLSGGQPQPLPSGKDVSVMGAHAEREREDEQQQQTWGREDTVADRDHQRQQELGDGAGGPATPTPWQPADPDDDGVRQAMRDHDDEHGIGPRNVGKAARDEDHQDTRHDRNPALTEREDDLADVFDAASRRLVTGLVAALTGEDDT